ncbi:MAG: SMC-Scp complex subunit ScpB [Kiloniellales bacterium]|nr:SMC-Scp complex subunit ScpB [Kiloniellales bacterium]
MSERFQHLRLLEAILFAAAEPLSRSDLARHLPEGVDLDGLLEELRARYADRGVHLVPVGQRWAFRTAPDLSSLMLVEREVVKKLSRAALETLAIIAYHQPVTRAEIEEIRGVALSRGTLDTLLETDWIKPKGRRRTPGRPVTWGTSDGFLDHFGLESLEALPGVKDLKAAGLLDSRVVPAPDFPGESEDAEPEGEGSEDPWEMLAAEFGDEGEKGSTAAGEKAAQAAADTKTPGS